VFIVLKTSQTSTSVRSRDRFFRRRAEHRYPQTNFKPQLESLESRRLLAAAIFEVTNTNDSGEGSLRAAIADANANAGADTITFADSVAGTITLDPGSGQLVITDDVTIRGPGTDDLTVSGGGATRVFAVLPAELAANPLTTPTLSQVATSPAVTIERLAIADGWTDNAPGFDPSNPENPGFAFGGGLYNLGGSVHLDRVAMSSNVATNVATAGGAVANEFGGTLTVSRSSFEDNTAGGLLIAVGGAITSDLGPVIDDATGEPVNTGQPEVSIEGSSFVGNSAVATFGYIDGVGVSGLGGGGALLNVTGKMTVNRSHFEGNEAQGGSGGAGATLGGPAYGGAILSGDASPFGLADSLLEVTQSTFVANTANGGAGGEAGIVGGQAGGGAISLGNLTDAELTRNHFSENAVLGGVGGEDAAGGLASGGGVVGSGGAALTLERNRFVGNRADGGSGSGTGASAAGRGGALALESVELAGFVPGPATATIVQDVYHANFANGGGGIYNDGNLAIKSSTVSDNVATGDADVFMDFYPGYEFQGAALGGGVTNLGTLSMTDTLLSGNQAIGADGAQGPNVLILPPGSAALTYPGLAVGGGLHTLTEATIEGSRFVGNDAIAGDNNSGSFPGVANGGGIYNDGSLVVSHTTLADNRVIGGDNNLGDINAGGGYGGGISSGSVTALGGLRTASLEITHSRVIGNEAIGGDGNAGLFPVPLAHAAGGGIGGGLLVYQGTGTIDSTQISRNIAAGGEGGLGAGGGLFAFGFVGPVEVDVSRSLISHNTAVGGVGGDALGGGVSSGSLGSLFGGTAQVSLNRSLVFANLAQGGVEGDASGGGIFNDSDGTVELARSLVFRNQANGGSAGDGIGGGVFNLGTLDLARSKIFANLASLSDDDYFGC